MNTTSSALFNAHHDNHHPSDTMPLTISEKATLNAHLDQIESTLDDIHMEELQLSQRLTTLRRQRYEALVERNRILNNAHSPIYMLPNELLAHIFILTTTHPSPAVSQRRADVVSHVCHRWREAAVSEPSLWRYINMKEGPPYEKSTVYLERSGGTPFVIDVDFTALDKFDLFEREFISQKLVPELHRCQSFHVSSRQMEPFWLALPRFTTHPAPFLEKFEVFHYAEERAQRQGWDGLWAEQDVAAMRAGGNRGGAAPQTKAFGGHAPNLTSMSISGLHVPWQSFEIASLTSFAFDFHSTDVRRSLRAFTGVLQASSDLRVLTIMQGGSNLRISPNWLADETVASFLPPSATHFRRIKLPALQELVYTFAETSLACDLISLLSTPNVHSLTLEYIKNDCASLLELLAGPPPLFPKLENLRLLGLTSIAPGWMLTFLRNAARNVRSLHVNAVNCPTLKEIAFLSRWMAMERREYLLPHLQEISSEGVRLSCLALSLFVLTLRRRQLTPRNLREMIQSRPVELRPKKIMMRRRDWVVPDDECMAWLKDKVEVEFVEGSSDNEDD